MCKMVNDNSVILEKIILVSNITHLSSSANTTVKSYLTTRTLGSRFNRATVRVAWRGLRNYVRADVGSP